MVKRRAQYSQLKLLAWLPAVAIVSIAAATAAPMLGSLAGYGISSVQSDSMSPAIRKGDAVITTEMKNPAQVQVGDIVNYQDPGKNGMTITHRVVYIEREAALFIAKGDNNLTADKPLPLAYVQGKVARNIPSAGYVLDAARHPAGLIIAVYLPAAAIIVSEVRRLARQLGGAAKAGRRRYQLHYYYE